jgi:mRNA interferase RelE/StbE
VKVQYRKRFLKELAEVPAAQRREIEQFVFDEFIALQSISESGKIERMKGYPGFYKIRFGEYRVGLKLEGDTVILERVLHRKDIYRYFP